MKEEVLKNTKAYVFESVQPVKEVIQNLTADQKVLGNLLTDLENRPLSGSSSDNPQTNKVVKDLQNASKKLDPALRRAAFIGWPESTTAEKREELMRKFGKDNFPGFSPTDVGHDFTGPYGQNRKMTTSSWIEFSNIDSAKTFIKKAED